MAGRKNPGWTYLTPQQYGALSLTGDQHKLHQVGIKQAAEEFAKYWRNHLDQAGSGRLYNVNFRTVKRGGRWMVIPVSGRSAHQASAPGESPTPDSGALRDSIKVLSYQDGLGQLGTASRAVVGTRLPYAAFLEFGVGPNLGFKHKAEQGEGGGRPFVIEPRPHLRRTMQEDLGRIKADMIARVGGALVPGHAISLDVKRIRRQLLRLSAKLGQFQLFGINSRYLFLIRQRAIKMEQALGDLQAFQNGTVAGRVRRKIIGRNIGIQLNKMAGNHPGDPRFWKAVKRQARNTLGQIAAPFIR